MLATKEYTYNYLTTPHPDLRVDGQTIAEPLFVAAGIAEARQYLDDAPDYESAKLDVAHYIANQVHITLRYPDSDSKQDVSLLGETAFETLETGQVTTCLGYSYVVSECLEAAGVEHFIGYTNDHSLIVVPTYDADGTPRLHSVDALFPKLNHDITDTLFKGDAASIIQDLAYGAERTASMVDLGDWARKAGKGTDLTQEYGWLSLKTMLSPAAGSHSQAHERQQYKARYTSVLSVFNPKSGRQMLLDYTTLESNFRQGNISQSVEALQKLEGLYPQIDIRAPQDMITTLVRAVCDNGEYALAHSLADSYVTSFAISRDPRVQGLRGDLLRIIAVASTDPDMAHKAAGSYSLAVSLAQHSMKRLFSEKYRGKVEKARSIQAALAAKVMGHTAQLVTA